MTWSPPPFSNAVEIQMWTKLQGIETAFTISDVPAEHATEAAEHFLAQILGLKKRLTPPPKPRKIRKAASAKTTK